MRCPQCGREGRQIGTTRDGVTRWTGPSHQCRRCRSGWLGEVGGARGLLDEIKEAAEIAKAHVSLALNDPPRPWELSQIAADLSLWVARMEQLRDEYGPSCDVSVEVCERRGTIELVSRNRMHGVSAVHLVDVSMYDMAMVTSAGQVRSLVRDALRELEDNVKCWRESI